MPQKPAKGPRGGAMKQPRRKPAKSQARLKQVAATKQAKAYKQLKTKSLASHTGKVPTITKGPLTGTGVAQPGQAKARAKMKAAMMVGQSQRVRKKKSPAQAALVKSAMPKAKAQRSPQEIAAMHAYRASKRKKAKKTTRTLYGPKNFY